MLFLVLIFWKIANFERIGVYTSGATQREIGQVFSGTDQGSSGLNYNPALLYALEGD